MFAYILICLLSAALAGYLSGREVSVNGRAVTIGAVLPLLTCVLAGISLSVNVGSILSMCFASVAVACALSSVARQAMVTQKAYMHRRKR